MLNGDLVSATRCTLGLVIRDPSHPSHMHAGSEKAPGPIPEHLLAEDGNQPTQRRSGGGSITDQLRGAAEPQVGQSPY